MSKKPSPVAAVFGGLLLGSFGAMMLGIIWEWDALWTKSAGTGVVVGLMGLVAYSCLELVRTWD